MKIGLKLWSTNIDYYFDEAKRLYQDGLFDYIELYIVPDTLQHIDKWKSLDIPFALHVPHFMHDFNLALADHEETNIQILSQVNEFAQCLNPHYVIVHGGMEGSLNESIKQFKQIFKLFPLNYLVENKPYVAPLIRPALCRGSTLVEIRQIIEEVGCNFCLDIGHAICAANSLAINPYEFLYELQKLNPSVYHISDNDITSSKDSHLNLGQGNYDFEKIFSIINPLKPILIETNKSTTDSLNDFIFDVRFLNAY